MSKIGTIHIAVEFRPHQLKNDIAKCTPIYNLYQSVIVIGMCKYVLDAFSGFWFSVGWCIFFFIPSTIFAVKLAKHYRKMRFLDEYDYNLSLKNNDFMRIGR
ncbi:hypothetical protein LOTGIDRAFT_175168 [Lottia gigantea]|uniref:Uncharacterized protein n=1 Tax=Lottia gigantea TaxID=225164 RepID=V4ALB1_LOTGI|nr:hypothetical protein LOTGIDRAFT_175168 [Lottia gigantea]ESO95550.1 hypothetical protein LOTGIDRAFT_175168 [Lottia gigantea]